MMEFVVYPGETVFVPSGWYVLVRCTVWVVVKSDESQTSTFGV